MSLNVAVVGATGMVGLEILRVLNELKIQVNKVHALASESSVGKKVLFRNKPILVESLQKFDFKKVDIAFFSAGSEVSKKFVPIASKSCYVIDNTPCFRREEDVPLVVPEINKNQIQLSSRNIVANPNCAAIQVAVPMNIIHKSYGVNKAVISTYQSVSGAGNKAVKELKDQIAAYSTSRDMERNFLPRQIFDNVIPQIDVFYDDGVTGEEDKVAFELNKIISTDIQIEATCVRVPVTIGHSASIYLECDKDVDISDVENKLLSAEGVIFSKDVYFTPHEVKGRNAVFVSRVRKSRSSPKSLQMWVVADNLRKGAAYNAVQISQCLNFS
ncbi:MAG: aspartate-semialdehyde dehydrogenase [Rickettsiales bacterium]